MTEISMRSIERLLKKAGCKRISVEAVKELQKILEKQAIKLGKQGWKFTKHANRRTLMEEDIKLAFETSKK